MPRSVSVTVQPRKQNQQDVYFEISCKELAQRIMGANSASLKSLGQTPRKVRLQLSGRELYPQMEFLYQGSLSDIVKSLSRVRLFATPWTVAYPAPPSMGFSRQEYWSGLPFPSGRVNDESVCTGPALL